MEKQFAVLKKDVNRKYSVHTSGDELYCYQVANNSNAAAQNGELFMVFDGFDLFDFLKSINQE